MISLDDFKKVELRVAKILEAEAVPETDKLVRLTLSLGESTRQIIAGIRTAYEPESLIGKEIVVVANLEPRMLKGLESNGMLLAVTGDDGLPILLVPEKEVPPGTKVK